jgi:hypothetical protein
MLANLVQPQLRAALRLPRRPHRVQHVAAATTRDAADRFLAAPTRIDSLVARAYRDLERQTDRQFTALTSPSGPYQLTVVATGQPEPYANADELIESVQTTRVLEVTTAAADRTHPLLDGAAGGAYFRFRAVHDLVGHVETGYRFDPDGEYSAWLVQRLTYQGLARWAAATELHGEISVLWTTEQFADHKAALLAPCLGRASSRWRSAAGRCRIAQDGAAQVAAGA